MKDGGHRQTKGGDGDEETFSRIADPLEAAVHAAYGRGQDGSAGVAEALTGLQRRLFTDDTRSLDFLDMTFGVRNDPVAIEELCRLWAVILHGDLISEGEMFLLWAGLFRQIARLDADLDFCGGVIFHGCAPGRWSTLRFRNSLTVRGQAAKLYRLPGQRLSAAAGRGR